MEENEIAQNPRVVAIWGATLFIIILGGISFLIGMAWSSSVAAAERPRGQPKVVYRDKTQLDFEGAQIEGELRNPSEFYFQRKSEEKFDSLVKRRKNFRREMLRDVVLSK